MRKNSTGSQSIYLGEMPALQPSGRRMPDKRQVSLRWLSGAILTGLTSAFLMGGALLAALDGRHQLAQTAQAYESQPGIERPTDSVIKGAKPGRKQNIETSTDNIMMVSTVTREGARDVVKVRPFLHIDTVLALAPADELDYPRFDALTVFSDSGKPEPVSQSSDLIYGAQVETEVTITLADFDPDDPLVAKTPLQRGADIEEMVRNIAPELGIGTTTVASLSYLDPARFSLSGSDFSQTAGVTITAENVSIVDKQLHGSVIGSHYDERVIKVHADAAVAQVLKEEGVGKPDAELLEKALSSDLGGSQLRVDDRARIAYEVSDEGDGPHLISPSRVSIYRGGTHLVSIARTDNNRFVYAPEPDPIPQIGADDKSPVVAASVRLPSSYDAIYRAAISQGLNQPLAGKLIRIFAFDVDFDARISPADKMEVFVSLEDGKKEPTEQSDILYTAIKLGNVTRKYYRYRDSESGHVDYYDETGKSAKKFLLRQPVPNARFRSPFGKRFHPIHKYSKMHWGVDWAAPRGTPILAAGNGVVEAAGWTSGYGRQVKLAHANGYETSYSHQSRIAEGIKPGVRVSQGQVIGYVGSTGLSTGPHLHYEVIVNGTKVDPMRIRLPNGKVLDGDELVAFQAERDRIDALLSDENETTRLAQK
jgi:murein DD-endopeptidase MepM/ murein hydrolase activator NlpD